MQNPSSKSLKNVVFSFLSSVSHVRSIVSASLQPHGNGNPLQYSCLENPMDGGAWYATVHGVAKSQTRLSDFTFFLSSFLSFQPHGLQPTRLHCPWVFPGKDTGVGAISFSRGSSWHRDRSCISCASCTAGGFFTTAAYHQIEKLYDIRVESQTILSQSTFLPAQ